ncbi:MAG TPA: hypothetical protein VNU70_10635, partial [Puia sp.]|nr:hypothetical protein [Puia sp.]
LVYAYLQKGDNKAAREELKYIATIGEVYPTNFKVAYTFAASPCRAALENKDWEQAAGLSLQPASFPWERFPWQEAIVHFGRLLGSTHSGDMPTAQTELSRLNVLYDTLRQQHDAYKSKQVAIQITAGEAWIASRKGEQSEALRLMKKAADMEDSTSKHPVTPGEVLPARELYADLLLEVHQDAAALEAYESVLQKCPNRFNSLYGAGVCCEKARDQAKAAGYYRQLVSIAAAGSSRGEVTAARAFLKRYTGE